MRMAGTTVCSASRSSVLTRPQGSRVAHLRRTPGRIIQRPSSPAHVATSPATGRNCPSVQVRRHRPRASSRSQPCTETAARRSPGGSPVTRSWWRFLGRRAGTDRANRGSIAVQRRRQDKGLVVGRKYEYRVIGVDEAANRAEQRLGFVATGALLSPTPGLRITMKSPPTLVWAPAKSASYYNLQLIRAGRKVMSAWPSRTELPTAANVAVQGTALSTSAGRLPLVRLAGLRADLRRPLCEAPARKQHVRRDEVGQSACAGTPPLSSSLLPRSCSLPAPPGFRMCPEIRPPRSSPR